MAVTSTFTRVKLPKLFAPALRSPFSTGSRTLAGAAGTRFIPQDCAWFCHRNGNLLTTAENTAFLAEHDIDHDLGLATPVALRGQEASIVKKFGVKLFFHSRHIVNPFHLKYLDPRGHGFAAAQRARWARMAKEQPLWVITSTFGDAKSVVRFTAMSRVRYALYTALEERGYDRYGNRKDRRLQGTLRFQFLDSIKAVNATSQEIGPVLVDLLEELTSVGRRGQSPARSRPAPARPGRAPAGPKSFRPRN